MIHVLKKNTLESVELAYKGIISAVDMHRQAMELVLISLLAHVYLLYTYKIY